MRFEYNRGFESRFPVTAAVAGRELEKVRKQDPNGKLAARAIWTRHRDASAPLHACFTWNNKAAADLHRDEEARNLIRSIKIVVEEVDPGYDAGAPLELQPYLSLSPGTDYHDVRDVMEDPGLKSQLLAKALREAEAWMLRYQNLKELAVVFKVIKKALDKLKRS